MWLRSSRITSCPGRVQTFTAIWLPIVPVGTNRADSFPVRAAASSSRRRTVGSSRNTSSPTSARAMAVRIASVGRVTVSERRSMKPVADAPDAVMRPILHEAGGVREDDSAARYAPAIMRVDDPSPSRGRGRALPFRLRSKLFLRPGQGFEQGFARYDNPQARWDGDSAGPISAAALDWLKERPVGRPFFLWVHYLDPHWTYRPLPPFDRAFDPDFKERFTLYEDLEAGRLTKGQVIFENRLDARQVAHVAALYDGEIAQVDAALAGLLDYAARPELQPLLLVLTSDH